MPHVSLLLTTLALALPGCAAHRAAEPATPEQRAVMATVHEFTNSFNAGDTETALTACADELSIIDDFPPYEWHGAGAGPAWIADFGADSQRQGISDGIVTLGAARYVDVTADRAYVVVPAEYAFAVKGRPVKNAGATITFSLKKGATGWRITGWAWAKG